MQACDFPKLPRFTLESRFSHPVKINSKDLGHSFSAHTHYWTKVTHSSAYPEGYACSLHYEV
jgi:hypothetical protein